MVVFVAMRLIPGDPIDVLYGTEQGITNETRITLRHRLGLDQPLPIQYLRWLRRFLVGDWGVSYFKQVPVFSLVIQRLPATLLLTVSSLAFVITISLPFGFLAGSRPGSCLDYAIMTMTFLVQSMPSFWLGTILVSLFSLRLQWLPSFGFAEPRRGFIETLKHLIMPSISLGAAMSGTLTRMIRSDLSKELNKKYVLTAKAKGLPRSATILKHAFRKSLIPWTTTLGTWIGAAMSGSVVVETVFTWPGIGRLLYEAVLSRDYPVVQSIVLITSVVFGSVNLIVDVLYSLLDPRIQLTDNIDYM
jgi:peptide/nickel transport system permease protein